MSKKFFKKKKEIIFKWDKEKKNLLESIFQKVVEKKNENETFILQLGWENAYTNGDEKNLSSIHLNILNIWESTKR